MDYNYGYNDVVSSADGVALGILAGAFLILFLIMFIIWAIGVIGKWKIFGKANQPKWAAFIPIYDIYILCKTVGVNPWWILISIIGAMLSAIPVIGSLISLAISIYFGVLLAVSTARSFGKSDGFAIGLFIFQPIFLLILGLGGSEYQGQKPMDDIVMNKIKSNNNNTNSAPTPTNNETTGSQEESKFCPYCGTKVSPDTTVCPNCGKDI